jgi:uncharacterized membrane protein
MIFHAEHGILVNALMGHPFDLDYITTHKVVFLFYDILIATLFKMKFSN